MTEEISEDKIKQIEVFFTENAALMDNLALLEEVEKTATEIYRVDNSVYVASDYPKEGYYTAWIDSDTRGVSKSRNRAIANAMIKKVRKLRSIKDI